MLYLLSLLLFLTSPAFLADALTGDSVAPFRVLDITLAGISAVYPEPPGLAWNFALYSFHSRWANTFPFNKLTLHITCLM